MAMAGAATVRNCRIGAADGSLRRTLETLRELDLHQFAQAAGSSPDKVPARDPTRAGRRGGGAPAGLSGAACGGAGAGDTEQK